ncbi:hypothetical protein SESBI_43851 [Sesbania bispinosa]|nr:hypothetical protein SESBI_43851 [Sesbania bispinosa]
MNVKWVGRVKTRICVTRICITTIGGGFRFRVNFGHDEEGKVLAELQWSSDTIKENK